MLIDTSEQPHKCKLCEQTFIQEEDLEAHILTHTGEKPYQCSECEKSFIQQKHLREHMLSHTDLTFKWTKETITLLLDCYQRRRHLFKNPQIKKSTLWKQILEEFTNQGYELSWENLDTKFRNLKKTYIKICNNNKICSGSGPVKWEFFHLFNDIFAEDISVDIDPNVIIESTNLDDTHIIEEEEMNHETVWVNTNLIESQIVKTPQKRKRNECDDKAGPSSVQSDSSTQSSYGYETTKRRRPSVTHQKKGSPRAKLIEQRKKILKLEEERVLALKNISMCLDECLNVQKEQLKVQKERNRLLTSILEKLN